MQRLLKTIACLLLSLAVVSAAPVAMPDSNGAVADKMLQKRTDIPRLIELMTASGCDSKEIPRDPFVSMVNGRDCEGEEDRRDLLL